ncbi:MAG: cation-translocating P-type ATPase, partial [bacterium]
PEAVADLCHFNDEQMQTLLAAVKKMSEQGLRVLGIAKSSFTVTELPEEQHDFTFQFLGLTGLADPVRSGVAESVRECYAAGMRVIMITGDYPGTAESIAREIGLPTANGCITGQELDRMDDHELQEKIRAVNIFARVVPEQKMRIVNALKANGEVVAMTGDGVNDAPALKAAHIGISMGGRGTDVAREASSLVLLDDDFSSIVAAVRMGRRIFDNLRKAIAYIFAVHVPIAGMSLIPVLFKWPLVLLPVHIVFLELIIDPACTVAFEAEADEADVMRRPPRKPDAPLFGKRTVVLSIMQGLSVLVILLAVFAIALDRGQGEEDARALTFTTLIIANLGLIFSNRSWSRTIWETLRMPNRALWLITLGTLLFLGTALATPFLRDLFHVSVLHAIDIIICLGAGLFSIAWFEFLKLMSRRKPWVRKSFPVS